MKVYHGERTEQGCQVTVDGRPLRPCPDLSGNATTPFDWGYVGSGQLSLALLRDLLGDDRKAKALYPAFEREVVAALPQASWTMTETDLANAVARADRDRSIHDPLGGGVADAPMPVGDMPVRMAPPH
jgi:hypothetical protein